MAWTEVFAACALGQGWTGCYGIVRGTMPGILRRVFSILAQLSSSTLRMLTKWFSSTRLETRTKESNIYASIWV